MRSLALIPLTAVIALAGCAATPEPVAAPSPTRTTNPAQVPCKEFEKLTNTMADIVVAIWTEKETEGDADTLAALPAEFDKTALKADGVIGERMAATVEILMETAPIVMSLEPDDYFASIEAVQRACDAEGIPIALGTWS